MSSRKERDIARQLAEREGLAPPAGLLERIKSEIPATIQLGAAAPRDEAAERRRAGEVRQRWLLAASIVAMVGAGFFVVRLRETPPAFEGGRRTAAERPRASQGWSGPRPDEVPGSSMEPGGASDGAVQPEPRRETPAPAMVPPPPKPASQEGPREVDGGVVGSVRGGVAGGVVGGVPSAPSPAPPPPAAKAVAAQPVQAPAPQVEETLRVTAESPLEDERRPAPKREDKPEHYDFDSFEETKETRPAAPAAPPAAAAPAPGVITDRINVGGNESGQQSNYVGPGPRGGPSADAGPGKAKGLQYPALAAAGLPAPAAPFRDAAAGRRASYGPVADTGSCEHARREVAAGRLPAPGSVRVGDFLAFLDSAEAGRGSLGKLGKKAAAMARTAAAPAPARLLEAQGAPNPFGRARSRLLLFRLRGGAELPAAARLEVELNPEVVARYREIAAGPGLAALYEVELKPEAASGRIATLRVRGLPGAEPEERELALSGLAASWEGATPGFRLAALAAELAESLKGYPWAPADLGALARQIRAAARGVPGNPRAAELADLAEAAARLRGNGGP